MEKESQEFKEKRFYNNSFFTIKEIALIGVFAALVLVSSKIEIPFGESRVHLGNTLCLLAGFILRPPCAGLAAGIGSLFFDLLFHFKGFECVITFFSKFVMGYVTAYIFSKLFKKEESIRALSLSAIAGEVAYIILYILKSFVQQKYIIGLQSTALWAVISVKLTASLINAGISIIIATILYLLIKRQVKNL